MDNQDKIVLMMVTFNRFELTKRSIKNIIENTDCNYQLVIVDNGSTDDTPKCLLEYVTSTAASLGKKIDTRILYNPENRGIATGRNQCLKMADEYKPDWYSTIDNDIEVPKGWMSECIDIMSANSKMGMVGVNMEDKPYPITTMNGKTFQLKPQGNLGTACTVFPRKLHQLLGFFNTEYQKKYGEEDADWGMRARVVGYSLGYIERMGVHFGVGANDTGEYRKFKTECHEKNLDKFRKNCADYYAGRKSYFIPYREL
jgi:GT2 family glycosyltransferase